MVQLYVDRIDNNGKLGSTVDPKKIAYNNQFILGEAGLTEFTDYISKGNESSFIRSIGRFMVICNLSLDDKHYSMFIWDLECNDNYANTMMARLDDPPMAALFEQEYSLLKEVYQQQYHEVEILIGNPPPTNP